ncbi:MULTISPECIES: type III pantothenate kinase [Roseivirga]|uniref:Type III pantothenate kinase n=1 Tax=Roseivirga spongicola TaxID=333140 RepID=A0A150XG67_9BACT|nr:MULTISPECIES: type III pantothenate kinase [Roseivirga]KYG77708.1 type III pantothenate kinase [Roseivirga spongicola]MBO6661486.1 type III pantothenate kinase [Roseivirga sp.]MBO6759416.1 type III pantothenate kinase [Roseivirga sp.]MBO6908530.1 type III pantothenate kinase [Roseivirga sp.]WPZ11430.1 type III pantothenate kinase [Roseivirga spongicola]
MLLAIDAGNTNIVFGVYKDGEWIHEWRFNTLPVKDKVEYEMFLRLNFLEANLKLEDVDGIVISSVVPQLNDILSDFSRPLINKEPLFIGPKIYDKLPVRTKRPYQIGTDLVSNAVAGYSLYKEDIIIVDFGTALTFTIVGEDGLIQGVNIAPGLRTAIKALVGNTAQLPEVPLELPESVLGADTIHAIQSGVLWGYVSMVEGMLDKIHAELGKKTKVVATGGLSSVLHPLHKRFDEVKRHLTLDGLRLIHEIVNNG